MRRRLASQWSVIALVSAGAVAAAFAGATGDAATTDRSVALSNDPSIGLSTAAISARESAAGRRAAAPLDAAAVRGAIEKANAAWLAAYARGDRDGIAKAFAPDATLTVPGDGGFEGRDRIADYFGAQHRAGAVTPSLKTVDVVPVGEVAYETGLYGMPRSADGSAADAGRYFAIWKAQGDGTWVCQVGIWTSTRDRTTTR